MEGTFVHCVNNITTVQRKQSSEQHSQYQYHTYQNPSTTQKSILHPQSPNISSEHNHKIENVQQTKMPEASQKAGCGPKTQQNSSSTSAQGNNNKANTTASPSDKNPKIKGPYVGEGGESNRRPVNYSYDKRGV
ncbi:hypothetical protein HYFRA_00007450 [Hymenoscyphus fraxineus]|uniref:Uncharacterized protein n=1 Tax=Hymenoscyphus fraxineus TaxID=746836 RepID=A0A9N9KQB4_9HELO|nr:hypothetical protein HYFRA_00007450 [Hymenoscyphus fraxineus]